MLQRLRLKTKVQLLPGLTGIAFLLLIAINISHGRENSARLAEIESGHFPALEASRELVSLLEDTRRIFQDAATAQDAAGLDAVTKVQAKFNTSIDALAKSSVVAVKTVDDLRAAYGHYVTQGTAATRHLISEAAAEPADDGAVALTSNLEQLTAEYTSLQASVKTLSDTQRAGITNAFTAARDTSSGATRANVDHRRDMSDRAALAYILDAAQRARDARRSIGLRVRSRGRDPCRRAADRGERG